MQLTVGVFKHMVTADMYSHVFFPEPLIQTFQLLAEISWEQERKENRTESGRAKFCLPD